MLLYLTENYIAEDNAYRRKTMFVSEPRKDIHQVLSNLRSHEKLASKTLEQLLKKLKDHFESVPYEMVESFKLWTKVQKTTKASPL